MVLPRATAFRGLLRSSAQRTSRNAGGAWWWGQTARRSYASGGHEAKKSGSDLPWLIGSIAVTAPSAYWLIQQGPGKSHGHSNFAGHHEEKEHGDVEAEGKVEDTSEGKSDDSSDESKQNTPDTSDDETESGDGDAGGSTEGGEVNDKENTANPKKPAEGNASNKEESTSNTDIINTSDATSDQNKGKKTG